MDELLEMQRKSPLHTAPRAGMSEAQLGFLNGPTFRGLWVSNVVGRGRLWTVTWVRKAEFAETDYCQSAGEAIDAAIRLEERDWQ